jgi:hypothetical protein
VRIFRFVWAVSAAVIVISAAAYDVLSGGLLRMVALWLTMSAFGGLFGFVLAEDPVDRRLWTRRAIVWSGLGAVAAYSLMTTWGGVGAAVGGALVLTSPVVLGAARGFFVSWSSRRTSGPPEALATRDLHRRWECTTAEVLHPHTSLPRKVMLAEERRHLLDELQRRDPAGFDAWIVSAVPDRRPDRQRPRLW